MASAPQQRGINLKLWGGQTFSPLFIDTVTSWTWHTTNGAPSLTTELLFHWQARTNAIFFYMKASYNIFFYNFFLSHLLTTNFVHNSPSESPEKLPTVRLRYHQWLMLGETLQPDDGIKKCHRDNSERYKCCERFK